MSRTAAPLRLAGDLLLGSRRVVAAYVHRHPDQVRRHCQPVACDTATHALLYDADDAVAAFREIPRRAAV